MPKKVTLFSYSKEKEKKDKIPDKHIINFLKSQKKSRILFIGFAMSAYYADKQGFKVTIVDDDLGAIKDGKALSKRVTHEYNEFFNYSKKSRKNSFDIIVDKGYSQTLRRNKTGKFYKEIAKLLTFNGKLLTKVYSTTDSYCIEHCPKRHWTYIENNYLNFFTKQRLLKLLHINFKVQKYSLEKYIENEKIRTYHFVVSVLKVMKL